MAHHYHLGLLVLLVCFFLEAASKPSNNEPATSFKVEVPIEELESVEQNRSIPNGETSILEEQRSMQEEEIPEEETNETQELSTQEILDKIKAINNSLKRPHRQQIKYNNAAPFVGGGYVLDKAILEKIQQIIASGKLHGVSQKQPEESNSLTNENYDIDSREGHSRALRYVQPAITNNGLSGQPMALVPLPYLTNMPVVVMPTVGNANGYATNNDLNSINSIQHTAQYATRQGPSLPFQIQWPLAPFFPVLVKDPLLHYLGGGSWENLIEYGQSADICNRKQKSADSVTYDDNETIQSTEEMQLADDISLNPNFISNSRQGRKINKIKKRTVEKPLQSLNDIKNLQNLFAKPSTAKPFPTKPVKKSDPIQDTKNAYGDEGDLRFPFGDFTWFGNRKPVAPSPGFFINRLKVRRGGVAIAGPGGVATAGRGGAAIVGPGGLAYTQPGGLAVAGPAARVVALTSDADLNSVVHRLQQQSATDGSIPRLLQAIPEGKVVATGPVIYYHPDKS